MLKGVERSALINRMLNKFLSFKVHNKFKNVAHVTNIAIVEHDGYTGSCLK